MPFDALTAITTLLYHNSSARQYGTTMLNALWIVLLGMAIIFAVLGILLLVMILLGKLFKPKEKEGKTDKQ
jgi:Na+-transporting methylmalonyl-CoA/oxaloacetate decarboxylase gamma subunit